MIPGSSRVPIAVILPGDYIPCPRVKPACLFIRYNVAPVRITMITLWQFESSVSEASGNPVKD